MRSVPRQFALAPDGEPPGGFGINVSCIERGTAPAPEFTMTPLSWQLSVARVVDQLAVEGLQVVCDCKVQPGGT
jgi:hypothetical protein